MDRKYVFIALVYGLLGLLLGLYMAAKHNHGQMVTHAHIMMVGFVVPFIYAVIHKLWLVSSNSKLATIQFYIHQIGALGMLLSLFMLYGGFAEGHVLAPVAVVSSVLVVVGFVLMIWMFLKKAKS